MIKYDKMFSLLRQKGYNYSKIREEKLIPEGTLQAIRKNNGGLSHKTIDRVCTLLHCQPNDIMEVVFEDETPSQEESENTVQ